MNKPKPKTLDERASKAAGALKLKHCPPSYTVEYRHGYDWGAYDGYKAGFKAGRRGRK